MAKFIAVTVFSYLLVEELYNRGLQDQYVYNYPLKVAENLYDHYE
jgi:hypothetical protein